MGEEPRPALGAGTDAESGLVGCVRRPWPARAPYCSASCQHFRTIGTRPFRGRHRGWRSWRFLKLFSLCQEELECDTRSRLSGTTAVCALLDLDRRTVVVAHTGDSKMVVASGDIVLETSDHRWDRDAEVRVLNRGGEVRNEWGCDRIFAQGVDWPGLAMSRSLGDVAGNQLGVSAEPEVTEELPLSVGSALVLGSDGLWDMVSPNFAVRKLRTVDEADHAAYTLVTTARQRWPAGEDIDDITAVTALLISQEVGSATEESR